MAVSAEWAVGCLCEHKPTRRWMSDKQARAKRSSLSRPMQRSPESQERAYASLPPLASWPNAAAVPLRCDSAADAAKSVFSSSRRNVRAKRPQVGRWAELRPAPRTSGKTATMSAGSTANGKDARTNRRRASEYSEEDVALDRSHEGARGVLCIVSNLSAECV